jgi:carboxymethylenebutenolidase
MIQTAWVETTAKDNTKLDLFTAMPEGNGKAPAIIVFQEAFGINAHIQDVCMRFAKAGFIVVSPDLFHRTGRKIIGEYSNFQAMLPHYMAVTRETTEADAQASYDWLRKQDRLQPNAIASIGFCMGGRASFIANACLPLKAAVSFYGGGIAPDHLDLAAKQKAPLLLVWGGKDEHIPAEQRKKIADALQKASHDFTEINFSKADHGFFCDQRPSYHETSATEAWALSLEYLRDHVK